MTNKRIFLLLTLICGITVFAYGKNLKNVSADEETTTCPLNKMVTVGSLLDQSLISINNLLIEADIILINSSEAYQAASDLVKASKEDCVPESCQSSCVSGTVPVMCDTSCTDGYDCSTFQGFYQNGELDCNIIGCAFIPNTFCPTLPWYSAFSWTENDPCISTPCTEGTCFNPACEDIVCDENACAGEACPFALIASLVDGVAANITAIEDAHNKIEDFFEKKIKEFPQPKQVPDNYTIFGKFCEHPILSKTCDCSLLSSKTCESEFYALVALQSNARSAIQKCDIIKPDDLFTEMQGEILFRCQDVRPSPIEQCWQDDFFCCTAEEPK